MVGISGWKDRRIKLVKDKYGNDVVVFSGWENWEQYYKKYVNEFFWDKDENLVKLDPMFQWQWKQNYPELVVEDIIANRNAMDEMLNDDMRNWLYSILLYRGINKWLFVRYLLIRYKKLVADWRNGAWDRYLRWKKFYDMSYSRRFEMSANEWGKVNYMNGYCKGYYDAMRKVRANLKTLCTTPRYVVWNGGRVGFVVDNKIHQGWLELIKELYDVKFER